MIPSVGVTLKVTPLQVVAVIALIVDPGLMNTVTVKFVPAHAPEIGLTKYVAVTEELVLLVKVPEIEATPETCDTPPLKPVPVGTPHVYNVPAGTIPLVRLVGVTVKLTLSQVITEIAETLATGLIVTVTVNTGPSQAPVVGITT